MRVLQAFSTTVGTKILIAVTGVFLVGFLIFHLFGNLLLFLGPESYNEHAHALISNPLILPAEFGLIAIFLLHVYKAVVNYARNLRARPIGYAMKKNAGGASRKTLASTTMIVSGIVMFAFVLFHLYTFKYGPYYATNTTGVRDLYRLLIEVFHKPFDVVFYVICMLIIGLHLRHGVSSAFQSLGLIPERWTRRFLQAGFLLAAAIAGGFVLIPLWVFFRL